MRTTFVSLTGALGAIITSVASVASSTCRVNVALVEPNDAQVLTHTAVLAPSDILTLTTYLPFISAFCPPFIYLPFVAKHERFAHSLTHPISPEGESQLAAQGQAIAKRIAGDWQLSGLALPLGQNLFIRARGYYATGDHSGSGSVVESVRNVYLTQAPAIISANTATFVIGAAGLFTVTATGVPTPTITLSGTLPDGFTFSDNGNGAATLAGTPASSTVGVYPLTFMASNDVLPNAMQNFTLTVRMRIYLPLVLSTAWATPIS
jgi:hypothetical protein